MSDEERGVVLQRARALQAVARRFRHPVERPYDAPSKADEQRIFTRGCPRPGSACQHLQGWIDAERRGRREGTPRP